MARAALWRSLVFWTNSGTSRSNELHAACEVRPDTAPNMSASLFVTRVGTDIPFACDRSLAAKFLLHGKRYKVKHG